LCVPCLNRQVPYLNRFSEPFKDFLCKASHYELRTDINELLSHPWLVSEDIIGADISIKELLGMSFVGSKEPNFNSDKQVELLLESLQVVLTKSELQNITLPVLKKLSLELGVNAESLRGKVISITKNL